MAPLAANGTPIYGRQRSSDLSTPPSEDTDLEKKTAPRGRKRAATAKDSASGSARRAKKPKTVKDEHQVTGDIENKSKPAATPETKAKASRSKKTTKVKTEDDAEADAEDQIHLNSDAAAGDISPPPKRKAKARAKGVAKAKAEVKAEEAAQPDDQASADDQATTPKPKRKRKTAEEKAQEAMPLAARAVGLKHYIGAHVSASGGVQNSITNAVHIGANAFALFLKSQRKWENPPLKNEHLEGFVSGCGTHSFAANKHVVPHGSYLVNLAAKDQAKADQAYNCFLDDLQRCEKLGIKLYNFHPGNTNGEPREEALGRIAAQLNRAHKATSFVVTLLENMAAEKNTIGGAWQDLASVIAKVDDKSRVGVCLDTCHAFAAGHDLRTSDAYKATMGHFDEVVGCKYLRAVHMNDSKAPFNSRKDLHYNIGTGFLGLRSFWNVMNDDRFLGLPLVLETPIDSKDENGKLVEDKSVWAKEIKLLESLVGMDPESEEFRTLEKELSDKGIKERSRLQEVVDRKTAEKNKKASKGGKERKSKARQEHDASSDLSDGESD